MTKPWDADQAAAIIAAHGGGQDALLPMLHDLQDAFGWIPEPATALLAAALNLTRAEVHGVVTFYHDFRRAPPGRKVLKLCRAEACQARGGRAVEAAARDLLKVDFGETTADGAVTLEPVYCLGLCASGPAAMVDGTPVARLTPARLADLLSEAPA